VIVFTHADVERLGSFSFVCVDWRILV